MMQNTVKSMRCEICDQVVPASSWGYGPWCDLYFSERRRVCLPRVLAAIKWMVQQQRHADARLLKLWAIGYWDLDDVDVDA